MTFENAQKEFLRLKTIDEDPLIIKYGSGPQKQNDNDFDVVERKLNMGIANKEKETNND